LLLNAIGPLEGCRVLWDEYYHGHRGSFADYVMGTPAPWALAQGGLILVAALLTFGRQEGLVRSPVDESRLSPLEFVDTVADLYGRGGAAGGAVEIAYQRFRTRLARRVSLPSTSTIDQLCDHVRTQLGGARPDLVETLRRCERGLASPQLTEWEAMQL